MGRRILLYGDRTECRHERPNEGHFRVGSGILARLESCLGALTALTCPLDHKFLCLVGIDIVGKEHKVEDGHRVG